ncbi:MAG: hypothetical protein OCD76_23255 [Reichenbachiella sp.]
METIKMIKYLTGFMGLSMFMTGFLKFFDPFKSWYSVQITTSELPFPSYAMGIAGEIVIGLVMLYVLINYHKLTKVVSFKLLLSTSVGVLGIIVVALFVHLHPQVPAEVLPLKIKPPIIPAMFGLAAMANIYLLKKTN